MNWRRAEVVVGCGLLVFAVGCSSVLPTTRTTFKSQWTNYADVQAAFDQIVPYQTTTTDLKALGFDPQTTPNIKVLTYVEVIQHFMPNPGITKADLDPAVLACIEARDQGRAYLIELSDIKSKRYGSVLLDIFGFKRRTHVTGWRFNGLILLTDHLVVYKLASGEPDVSTDEQRIKPLGPLQELDAALAGAASRFK
ncbi:MAG TPA: hypothetical protein VFV96_09030 [Verrucomicrobiae bacterium]|nr:hypothetical protein [Verrucomicrobiae bacterium]